MKADTHVASNMREVKQAAKDMATSQAMVWLARLGYAIKGVLYLVIGWLAAMLAIGHGGETTDQKGALHTISSLPFGKFLLAVVAIGCVGFGLWSFIQAIFDTEYKGKDAKGIIGRIGYAFVGASYLLLAFASFQLVMGSGNGGKGTTQNAQDWTALVLKQPFGVALVVIGGLIVLAVAAYLFYKAYSAKFQYRFRLTGLAAGKKQFVIVLGRLGYGALGVVFTIVGFFLIVAAFHHDASRAKGLDSALQELLHQPFGPFLLGIVALGLIAYGLYSFVEAGYRRIGK